jgi:hypothetical protein
MAYEFPNFTSPPNVGPEPPGLMQSVRQKIFGQGGAPDLQGPNQGEYNLDPKQLVQLLTDTRLMCEPGRELFEYGWWRNLLYLLGRQWIYWNPTARQWNDKRLAKWVPKPVTNIIRTNVLSIRAMLSGVQTGIAARPLGNTSINVLTAQVADDLEPVIFEEHDMDTILQEMDFWAIVTGNAFAHTLWDPDDRTAKRMVQLDQCQTCGQVSPPEAIIQTGQRCPRCQSAALKPAMGPDGQPLTQESLIGRGKTYAVSPFELLLPLYAQSWEAADRLVYLTWEPKHQIEDTYGNDIARKLTYDTGPQQRSLQFYKALATTSDLQMSPSSLNTGAFTGQVEGATVQHLWIKPNKKWPEGFYCRFLGDTNAIPVLYENGLQNPYRTTGGDPIWPWTHYPYERIGGRLYAQGAVDVIIQKQDQINQVDAMTQLTANRMGNPVWLEPKGAEVERFTGEPGLIVRWQPVGAQGAKPERISGENPPQSFFLMREQYKADAEELAGTYDVLKGTKPSGVEAYSALQLLVDQSQSRFTTLLKARGAFYRSWYTQALEFERVHGPDERTQAVMGDNRQWVFNSFQKANLQGKIEIVIQDGTNTPKTALGRRAAIEHANQMQLLSPQDPEQQYQLLQTLGLQDLVPSLDTFVKSALYEQQAFEEWVAGGFVGPSPLVRKPWQKDEIHYAENQKWMNSDRVREMLDAIKDPQQKQVIEQILGFHLMEHEQAILVKQGMLADPNAQGGGPPDAGSDGRGVGAARAMANSNANSVAATSP